MDHFMLANAATLVRGIDLKSGMESEKYAKSENKEVGNPYSIK